MSLQKKTIAGLGWTFSQQFSVQFINFGIQIILARLLSPAEFGLIGMISIFIAVGNSLIDSGMASSLIRTKDADEKDYSTVFWMNLIVSCLIYIILFFTAPFIADFYNQPLLQNIIRIYTISFIIRAFVSVQTTILTKEMKFKTQMFMQIPSIIVGGLVGLLLAYKGFGVWSIVWMNLTQTSLFTAQHWLKTQWYPQFLIDRDRLKQHLGYGYKLTMSGLLDTFFNNIYNVIIGKLFSPVQLGYYTRAQTLQMFPITNIATALNKVTFPMFAKIQDDNDRLRRAYQKLMQQVIFLIAPLMLFLMVIATPLFAVVLTDKWLPAVPYFQILCVTGILYPLHAYNLNILKVKGRSDLFFKLEVYKKIFICIGIPIALYFGIYGLLFFQIIFSVFAFMINTRYSGQMIGYSSADQVKDILPLIINAAIVAIIVWGLNKLYLERLPHIANLVVNTVLFWGLYLISHLKLKNSPMQDLKQIIIKR